MPFPGDASSSAEGTPRVSSVSSSREKRSDIQGKNDHSQRGWNQVFLCMLGFKKNVMEER